MLHAGSRAGAGRGPTPRRLIAQVLYRDVLVLTAFLSGTYLSLADLRVIIYGCAAPESRAASWVVYRDMASLYTCLFHAELVLSLQNFHIAEFLQQALSSLGKRVQQAVYKAAAPSAEREQR